MDADRPPGRLSRRSPSFPRRRRTRSPDSVLEEGRLELTVRVDVCSLEVFANDGEVPMCFHVVHPAEDRSLELDPSGGSARVVSLDVHELRATWR